MDWLDLLAVQGTFKSLLQHHSSKASILRCSAFFTVQLSHPYMTTGETIALARRTLVRKVMSLLLNMLSRLVITRSPFNIFNKWPFLLRLQSFNCREHSFIFCITSYSSFLLLPFVLLYLCKVVCLCVLVAWLSDSLLPHGL